jgi:sulfite reductase (NADPH) flavoprotein alpha-component
MPDIKLTVLYGTETGNSEKLAKQVIAEATKRAYATEIKAIGTMSPEDLSKTGLTLIVISTWGEGDPPGSAEKFCKALYAAKAPNLSETTLYTVLALGDKTYADYCGCGRKVDESLARMGGVKMMPRQDLDVDFDADFKVWQEKFFSRIETLAA